MINFRELVKAGIHFGHQTSRWHPNIAPYIWGTKNDAHLIDVSKTAYCLDQAARFLRETAKEGGVVLWVGTKKAAQAPIKEISTNLEQPYVNHRWIGGTLSNYSQVKKSITKMLHLEDVIEKTDEYSYYTKKEFSQFKKQVDRLNESVGGLRSMTWPITAVVIVDIVKEYSALKEALIMGIPVVAMVDTNADPSLVDYVVPANDDAPRSIRLIIEQLGTAISEGREQAAAEEKRVKEQQEQEAAKKAQGAEEKQQAGKEAQEQAAEKVAPQKTAASEQDTKAGTKKTTTTRATAAKRDTEKSNNSSDKSASTAKADATTTGRKPTSDDEDNKNTSSAKETSRTKKKDSST